MKHSRITTAAVAAAATVALALTACSSGGGGNTDPGNVDPEGEITPREISWLLSRPADGGVITAMEQIADEYAEKHPGFSLNLITTPDRPSYIQKYETLAAANKLPELFDTDATPFAKKLADQGRMVDAEELLKSLDLYDDYRPAALNYQRFDDGTLNMIPFEFQLEFFWYNTGAVRAGRRRGARVPRRRPGDVHGASRCRHHPDRARRPGPMAARAVHGVPPVPHRRTRVRAGAEEGRREVRRPRRRGGRGVAALPG